jgi:cytochrome c
MVKLTALVVFAGVAAMAFAQAPQPPQPKQNAARMIDMGRAIAQEKCQSCHATGPTGASALPKAPPLRTLSQKYPIDTLSEAFAEGVLVGHSPMPEFELEPAQIDALLTYIESIQIRPHRHARKAKAG